MLNSTTGHSKSQDKSFDQFYTRDDIAYACLKDLVAFLDSHHNPYDLQKATFLEPSAGGGAFLRALLAQGYSQFYACDIDPKATGITHHDFITDDLSAELDQKKNNTIVIGNPPFGKRASLASAFINRATLYADTIAFILPLQFQKYSAQAKLKPSLRLVFDKSLEPSSFVFNNKPYSVRCCFQIWTTRNFGEDLRLRSAPITKHKDFEMWQYNNTREAEKYFNKELYQWDFAIPRQGYKDYTIKETDPDKMSHHTQWIFFKAHSPEVLERLRQIDYEKLSHKNTSTPGFGKADVINEYNQLFNNTTTLTDTLENSINKSPSLLSENFPLSDTVSL